MFNHIFKRSSDNKEKLILIGKTSSPLREPNTTSTFYFWIRPGIKVNPFDFVIVEQADGSFSVGLIDEIFVYTDSESHLTNFIGNELGRPDVEPYVERVSAMVARAQILRNIRDDYREEIYMPVPSEKKVYLANDEAIKKALGYDRILGTPIPAGFITQSSGTLIPVFLDSHYVIGPEGAHANATGISGLATKTSYLMFLIYSLYNALEKKICVIIFNVKHSDLLHIHEEPDDLNEKDKIMYNRLNLKPKPFENVTYFLPRGKSGEPDSDNPPNKNITKLYAYTLEDVYEELDLLFSDVHDPYHTIDAFITYVQRYWQNNGVAFEYEERGQKKKYIAKTWTELIDAPEQVVSQAVYGSKTHATPPRIKRELRRLTNYSIFVSKRGSNEVYLGEAIKQSIKPGKINVIDIYRVPSRNWPFIIGDVMRNIEQMYREKDLTEIPPLIIFIDELNTFAPASETVNPVTELIIEIARKGRARKTALFGAQQFKSEVHKQIWGNCTLNIIGRTGSAELRTAPYGELDENTKNSILNLAQGEMVLSFRVWRYPIKVTFPKPPYKRLKT
ncbi:MAG: ATP-binding protein [Nitrososphaeria archaeon]